MRSQFALFMSSFLLIAGGLACGDSGSSSSSGGGDTGGSNVGGSGGQGATGAGDQGGGGGEPAECEAPEGPTGTPNPIAVGEITAFVKDGDGAPIVGAGFLMCGVDTCLLQQTSDATGEVFYQNGGASVDRPLLKPANSLDYGKIGYFTTGEGAMDGVFPKMVDSGSPLQGGTTVTAAGVAVTIPVDAVVEIDGLIYDEPQEQTFRAGVLTDTEAQFATGDESFSVVYSTGPYFTLFCPAASATFANVTDFPAGAAIEVYGQELEIGEHFAEYGKWAKIADGVVSADGSLIEVASLPVLSSVAFRLAP